jgi:hypothetical protein
MLRNSSCCTRPRKSAQVSGLVRPGLLSSSKNTRPESCSASRVTHRAGSPLKIGARLPLKDLSDPNIRADWAYFTDRVRPLLSGSGVELVGAVSDGRKAAFLGGALALLFPID